MAAPWRRDRDEGARVTSSRGLSTEQNDRLIPIVISCMEMTQKNLEGVIRQPIRFSATRGFIIDPDDNDVLKRPRHAYVLFDVSGDVWGKIGFLCPIPLAATLASLMRSVDEAAIEERRRANDLTADEVEAFREIGGMLSTALDVALRASSQSTIRVQFESSGSTTDWSPPELFDDSELLLFVTESKLGSYPSEEIHLIATRRLIREITGMDVEETEEDAAEFDLMAPEGHAVVTLLGAALGVAEKKAIRTICDAHSIEVHFSEDVRDLLHHLVNYECAGIIMGDKSATANARAAETNRAVLKRIRAHPKGKDLAVLCLAEWPDREHVMQMAQLGVRDVIGLPSKPESLKSRVGVFIEGTLHRHARRAA
jgi:hypothetical protein